MVIGYTTGVFDLFHYGHVRLLRNAKQMCDKLIVGVTIDELVQYKGKSPVITFDHRIEVVRACSYVDVAVPQSDMDKIKTMKKLNASILFVGDDWYESDKWREYEDAIKEMNGKVIYFPYTNSISSTKINKILEERKNAIHHNNE